MKKQILVLLLCSISTFSFSQEDTKDPKDKTNAKHEFRIDALEGLVVPALDISYEYIISQYSGVGATLWLSFDSDIDDYQDFAFTPYYRQYFFNKKDYGARGFYAEGLLQFARGEEDVFVIDGSSNNTTEDWSKFGIGFALGQKWVSKNGFSLDLNIGGGRYFGSSDVGPEAFIRGGIGVGYRF